MAATAQAFLATLSEAHAMVVPCMIDHLGTAHETAAVPMLLKVAEGAHPMLRDISFRIKAIEALGRMRVLESGPVLLRMVRQRTGLAHSEPAALRSAAEEALGLLENRSPLPRAARVTLKARAPKPTSWPTPVLAGTSFSGALARAAPHAGQLSRERAQEPGQARASPRAWRSVPGNRSASGGW